jgi:hypothetical protein
MKTTLIPQYNEGASKMINYRRFDRRRLLSIPLSEFHIAAFPVQVKTFHAPKSFRRPIT